MAETVIEDDGNSVRSRWCWWWPTGGGLDGGRWLWKPGTTTIFSSSSPCRGASLYFILVGETMLKTMVILTVMLVAVERKPMRAHGDSAGKLDDSSCCLFPSVEALLLLLVSFVPSVTAVLPSLQQLHGGAGGREWLWWELVWCGRPFFLFFSVFFFSPVLLCFRFFLLLFVGLLLTEMAMAAGGGGEEVLCSWWCCCGWEEDGERWLREPGDSSCSFLSAAVPSLSFFAFFPLSLVFPSVSGSGEVGR